MFRSEEELKKQPTAHAWGMGCFLTAVPKGVGYTHVSRGAVHHGVASLTGRFATFAPVNITHLASRLCYGFHATVGR